MGKEGTETWKHTLQYHNPICLRKHSPKSLKKTSFFEENVALKVASQKEQNSSLIRPLSKKIKHTMQNEVSCEDSTPHLTGEKG